MDNALTYESEILEHALHALHQETGLALLVEQSLSDPHDPTYDALVRLDGQSTVFAAEIKRWVQQTNFGALLHTLKKSSHKPILIADFINPRMAERLRKEQIQFIDTAGNAYIDAPPVYVYIKGLRPQEDMHTATSRNRAFDSTGLKVIYNFLCDPDWINASYRDIARRAEIAIGSVGWILKGLKDSGYIAENSSGRRLVNRRKLLDRWVETFPEKLKPKLLVGRFIAPEYAWWQSIEISKYHGYWSGEVAAEKCTSYLKPVSATVYLPKSAGSQFFADARLRKAQLIDKENVVEVYRPFWKLDDSISDFVHPVLIYADLIATADSRNLETAQIIYEKYLDQYFREDY